MSKELTKKNIETAEEKNARNQLSKFDKHFNDPSTNVRLDS